MDSSLLPTIISSAVGCLCCAVFWIAVIGGFMYMRRRGASEDAGSNSKIADKPDLSEPIASPAEANKAAEAAPGPDEAEDDADAATVAATPPTPRELEEAPAAPKKRTASATIIAFDDDFEDDDEE